jgi:CBS-domain-containing membrane protein
VRGKYSFWKNWPHYIGQPLGAAALLGLLFFHADYFFSELLVLSLGSSVFTLAVFPRQPQSSPRHLLGGYACGVLAGLLLAWLKYLWPETPLFFCLAGAVFVAILLMLAVNCRHAPGVSLALAVFFSPEPLTASALAMVSIALACLVKESAKRWLKDLA